MGNTIAIELCTFCPHCNVQPILTRLIVFQQSLTFVFILIHNGHMAPAVIRARIPNIIANIINTHVFWEPYTTLGYSNEKHLNTGA